MNIRKANERDGIDLVRLMRQLWPDAPEDELTLEVRLGIRSGKMHYFIAETDEAVGFCQLSFRHDYVPGTTSSPSAFLEGIYVVASVRQQDVATLLVEAASAYARSKGCDELASDTEVENDGSQRFHERIGFREVERTVHYVKKLSRE
ncbi:aminoglycoside 6'-N-acetyltransferase [Exiguobacterium mexicanum]|uniref:Aminoglycoside N(6')-acetyltransferase type 1 n=1 Tax=Exiguobacterium mexicanum TaxID=340146 RepID=A0ABT7MLM0_9BACL|nr:MULTISPECIES: aminoglycoside 6'-N-acetyltransferase [Exiguobacterium]MDL5375741.1 GNAT family N-acetyltransferase [Exiguobacterium mexicanum]